MNNKQALIEVLDVMIQPLSPLATTQLAKPSIASEYAEMSGDIVRPTHAREVLAAGNALSLPIGGHHMVIACDHVHLLRASFVRVVLAHMDTSQVRARLVIDAAYRLYGTAKQVQEWSATPRDAFAELIDRYGMRFVIEGQQTLWLPMMIVSLTDEEKQDEFALARRLYEGFGIPDLNEVPEHALLARIGQGEDGRMIVAGATMIDLGRYRAHVREHAGSR